MVMLGMELAWAFQGKRRVLLRSVFSELVCVGGNGIREMGHNGMDWVVEIEN